MVVSSVALTLGKIVNISWRDAATPWRRGGSSGQQRLLLCRAGKEEQFLVIPLPSVPLPHQKLTKRHDGSDDSLFFQNQHATPMQQTTANLE